MFLPMQCPCMVLVLHAPACLPHAPCPCPSHGVICPTHRTPIQRTPIQRTPIQASIQTPRHCPSKLPHACAHPSSHPNPNDVMPTHAPCHLWPAVPPPILKLPEVSSKLAVANLRPSSILSNPKTLTPPSPYRSEGAAARIVSRTALTSPCLPRTSTSPSPLSGSCSSKLLTAYGSRGSWNGHRETGHSSVCSTAVPPTRTYRAPLLGGCATFS